MLAQNARGSYGLLHLEDNEDQGRSTLKLFNTIVQDITPSNSRDFIDNTINI